MIKAAVLTISDSVCAGKRGDLDGQHSTRRRGDAERISGREKLRGDCRSDAEAWR
jgi:hypothetical protein